MGSPIDRTAKVGAESTKFCSAFCLFILPQRPSIFVLTTHRDVSTLRLLDYSYE